jgi:hypothetical protein
MSDVGFWKAGMGDRIAGAVSSIRVSSFFLRVTSWTAFCREY